MNFEVSETSRKLAKISEVMTDAYHFVTMREYVEQWQREADMGSAQAQEMMRVIDTFHRLCLTVQKASRS